MLKIWEVLREEVNAGRMNPANPADAKFAGGVYYRTTDTLKGFCPDFRERAEVFYLPPQQERDIDIDKSGIEFMNTDAVFVVFTKDSDNGVYTMLVHTEDEWLLAKNCKCTMFFKEVLREDGFEMKRFVKG